MSTHDARFVPIADRVIRMAEDADVSDAEPMTVSYTEGETIFRQGDRSEYVYTVESGEVEVIRELAEGGEEHISRPWAPVTTSASSARCSGSPVRHRPGRVPTSS